MSWWLTQAQRARTERVAVANLQEKVDWLKSVAWKISSDLHLSADFEIHESGFEIPLKIIYPAFFPHVPPQIYPVEETRVSRHQYGIGGELCLEIRLDNWEPEMTGAMMIESAHRLLSGEQAAEGESRSVPDAHRTTVAQDVRGEFFRILISVEAQQRLETFPEFSVTELEFEELYQSRRWITRPSRIGSTENPSWTQNLTALGPTKRQGYMVRLPNNLLEKIPTSFDGLVELAAALPTEDLVRFIQDTKIERPLLFVSNGNSRLLSLFPGEGKEALRYKTVLLPPSVRRQSADYDRLQDKSVAVVGCGSVGSKVAASLARSGVGRFVLVDGDILFPDNIVRNDLDQRFIGLNKPDAVMTRIQEINPLADVDVRRVLMGGQESSASTEAALLSVAQCDLIVDATADATIFNLCGAVAQNQRKSLVWGEVLAGGVGGLVARARPDIDPTPLIAKRQLAAWCADQGVPWNGKESEAYDLSRDDAPPLTADDAEVTIIAAHMTRLAIDTLVRDESIFPYSAYAIGLRQEWIFGAPFETFPISLEADGVWQQASTEESSHELTALMHEMFPDTFKTNDDG